MRPQSRQITNTIWIASYPRSGNTFVRTILWHCFGLRSGSIYLSDLGGNKKLEQYIGHIERARDGSIQFPINNLPLVKTHKHPFDDDPAIYVLRDGRAASVSLWEFRHREIPLKTIIEGKLPFGTWAAHVEAWHPWSRRNTLLLKYEEITGNLSFALQQLSTFLGRDILSNSLPDRTRIAGVDGRWVRHASDWRSSISGELLDQFNEINGDVLLKTGYIP